MNIKALLTMMMLIMGYSTSKSNQKPARQALVSPETILKDFMSLLQYKRDHLRLSEPFIALDENSVALSKAQFLKQVSTGNYLPLRLRSAAHEAIYSLYKLPLSVQTDQRNTLQYWGENYYNHYKKEGQPFPGFNFRDLNGKLFTSANTRGKIVVVKCWFIHCMPCIQEMPKLNQLVEKYKKRKDILFLSLVNDDEKSLAIFLKKTAFTYAVVPAAENFISGKLKINAYPTHILINKQGLIVKETDEAEELINALKAY
eukprot:gene4845-5632_t